MKADTHPAEIQTSSETVCPCCDRPTSLSELTRFSGVCSYCKKAFSAANKSWVEGKDRSHSSRETEQHHAAVELGEHLGSENHALVNVCDFDFATVEKCLGELHAAPESAQTIAAATLARIFNLIWQGNVSLKTATVKFAALISGIRPDLIEGRSFANIANELGVTKQAVCASSRTLQEKLKIHFAGSRSAAGRERMRRAALGHRNYNPSRKAEQSVKATKDAA